jgi:hypothetical protein
MFEFIINNPLLVAAVIGGLWLLSKAMKTPEEIAADKLLKENGYDNRGEKMPKGQKSSGQGKWSSKDALDHTYNGSYGSGKKGR